MEVEKCIQERRTIRLYKEKDVLWEKVSKILEAANFAPSSGNLQNWVFIVIKDPKNIEKVANCAFNQSFIVDAPVLIIICSKNEKIKRLYGERGEFYGIQNCAMASQNLMLKAHDFGLGTCYVGAFEEEKLKEGFNIPENIRPQGIITLGYPNESPNYKRQDLDLCVFFEEYGNRVRNITTFPLKNLLNKKIRDIKTKRKLIN